MARLTTMAAMPASTALATGDLSPTGPDWIHEIKHDGFRVIARRDGKKVRLISRKGKDLTYRVPLAVQAVGSIAGAFVSHRQRSHHQRRHRVSRLQFDPHLSQWAARDTLCVRL
jgi:hypothetical protein